MMMGAWGVLVMFSIGFTPVILPGLLGVKKRAMRKKYGRARYFFFVMNTGLMSGIIGGIILSLTVVVPSSTVQILLYSIGTGIVCAFSAWRYSYAGMGGPPSLREMGAYWRLVGKETKEYFSVLFPKK